VQVKYLVIKCGGSVLERLPQSFYENIVQLKENGNWVPIIVHGGGPLINNLLKNLQIETSFVSGLRVTTNEVLDIVEMVLSGSVNKKIVQYITQAGGSAFGVSGVDGGLLEAERVEQAQELGLVGEVVQVKELIIKCITVQGFIPVISPVGMDRNGNKYNINGDIAASAIAKALQAKLCMISDIPGICIEGKKLNKVSKAEIEEMINDNVIYGGMIPKVKAAIDSLMYQVPEVAIINGLEENSLLEYCEGKEIGTKIVLDEEFQYVN
jgi:acetylglutamate kinase